MARTRAKQNNSKPQPVKKAQAVKNAPLTATSNPPGLATRARAKGIMPKAAPPPKATQPRRCTMCKDLMKGHKTCKNGMSKTAALDKANDRTAALGNQLQQAAEALERLRLNPGEDEDEPAEGSDAVDAVRISQPAIVAAHGSQETATAPTAAAQEMVLDGVPGPGGEEIATAAVVADDMIIDPALFAGVAADEPGAGDTAAADAHSSVAAPLLYGFKSTPAGDVPLDMTRSAASKTPYADQRPCTKRTNGLFQAMAQKGDVLASRVDGWAFAAFVPKGGRGEMRSWHSGQVQDDVPELPGALRKAIFDALEPHRTQRLEEQLKAYGKREKKLRDLQEQFDAVSRERDLLISQLEGARNKNV